MNKRQKSGYDCNVAVRKFYTDRPDLLGSPGGQKTIAEHSAVTAKLDDHFVGETLGQTAAQRAIHRRAELRTSIEGAMTAVHRTSLLLPNPPDHLDDLFPLPGDGGIRQLVSEARAVVANALPLAQAFKDNGLADDVLANLPAQIQELDTEILNKRTALQKRMGAHAGVNALLNQATVLRQKLHRLLQVGPAQDAETMAIWHNARRIQPRRKAKAEEAVTTPVAAPTAQPTPATTTATESKSPAPQPVTTTKVA
jgi:hypothetical protein